MTDVVLPLVPPDRQAARSALPTTDAIADLFHATSADAATAVHESGGDLAFAVADDAARTFADTLSRSALPDAEVLRLELDVDTGIADVGPALRAIRDHSDAASVGVIDPSVGLARRTHLDTAAMRLRREDVVIGPTPGGGWWYLGTRVGADELPEVLGDSVVGLLDGLDPDTLEVGFLPLLPIIEDDADLGGLRELLGAMTRADRSVAPYAAAWFESTETTVRTDTS